MESKQERYFTGRPASLDPSKPIPGEMPPARRLLFAAVAAGVVLFGLGVVLGIWLAPEPPSELQDQVASLEAQLAKSRTRIAELERTALYNAVDKPAAKGALKPADRKRHDTEGRRYAQGLKRLGAQSAGDLVSWFVGRWNLLLDYPRPDDRVDRRAALLALLVEEMAKTLNPGDYGSWQRDFVRRGRWLGDLHFDMDGDGLPRSRSGPNTMDGFAGASVCHVAMAMNQAVTDAQILLAPEIGCARPDVRMSVLLNGKTLDDALDEFVRAVEKEGFLVKEAREPDGFRLIAIGKIREAPSE